MKKKLILSMLLAFSGQQYMVASDLLAKITPYQSKIEIVIETIKDQLTMANFNKLKSAAKSAVSENEKTALAAGQQLLPYAAFILDNYGDQALSVVQTSLGTAKTNLNTAVVFLPQVLKTASKVPVVGGDISKYADSIQQYANMIQGYVNNSDSSIATLSTSLTSVQSEVSDLMSASGMTTPANLTDAISGLKALIKTNLPAIKAAAEENDNVQNILDLLNNLEGMAGNLYGLMYYVDYYIGYAQTELVSPIQQTADTFMPMASQYAVILGISSKAVNNVKKIIKNLPTILSNVKSGSQAAYNDAKEIYTVLYQELA